VPEIAPADAARLLAEKIRAMNHNELRDIHNELFPETPVPRFGAGAQETTVRQKVLDYLANGIAVEEILDLWRVVFPEAWNVYYDDETETIHYLLESEAIQHAD
jgi:hypothetical protein